MDPELILKWIRAEVVDKQDPDLVFQFDKEGPGILSDAAIDALVNPPDPPPSVVRDLERQAWVDQFVDSCAGREVVPSRALNYRKGWTQLGSKVQMARAISNRLRERGYVSKTRRNGSKTFKVFVPPDADS